MGRARDIRLLQDQQKIRGLVAKLPYVNIRGEKGIPPTEYLLTFRLKGYINSKAETAERHEVRIALPAKYPFSAPPKFSFLRGLFHPNVYKNGDVCHGWYLNNWNPAIRIDDLLMDITKMIAFKKDSYNLRSPANYGCNQDWIATHAIPADHIDLESGLRVPKTAVHSWVAKKQMPPKPAKSKRSLLPKFFSRNTRSGATNLPRKEAETVVKKPKRQQIKINFKDIR
ncbi:MAG: ubiquitin-conjugating enzyme E2 [Chitinophagales bacterium]